MDVQNIAILLNTHQIRPSQHRIRIYQYLVEKRNHPSVDMIFQDLVKEIPTLSKTTVYNTLELFIRKGLATLITIDENEMRYDADTSVHGHFLCEACGTILDIRLDAASLNLKGAEGLEIRQSNIYFKGLCPKCLQKGNLE